MMGNVGAALTGFILVSLALATVLTLLPRALGPRGTATDPVQAESYECGEIPVGEPWIRYRAAYYVFALTFVLFDVEAVFVVPWAVIHRELGTAGLVEMGLFVGILAFGLVYVWRKGLLEWI